MQWKPGTPLANHQSGHPVIWFRTLAGMGIDAALPKVGPDWFAGFWGDTKSTMRLRTFGHLNPADRRSPHFLCTRGGTPMHTDPAYSRYALQLQLVNQGFIVHGLNDNVDAMPVFYPGLVILLDTHSPHKVSRDPRMPNEGPNKLLAGSDFADVPMNLDGEIRRIVGHLEAFQNHRLPLV